MVVVAATALAVSEEGRRRGAPAGSLRGRLRMPRGCETGGGPLWRPRRSCRRSPGPVLSWRGGGGGCGSDALSWLRFVMVPETPRPPQLALRDYHMTQAKGLRAAATSLAEEGARRRGALPPPPPPPGFGRPHPQHSPSARSPPVAAKWGGERRLFTGRGAVPGAVPSAARHPGRDAQQRGTGSCFLCPFLHPQTVPALTLPSSHLPALSFSLLTLPFSWANHSGPSSEHCGLKASSLKEIPMPGGFEGKTHGGGEPGAFSSNANFTTLLCANYMLGPTICARYTEARDSSLCSRIAV